MLQFCNEKRKKSIKISEKNFHENHDFCGFSDFERHFFDKICLNFRFLSSMSARSRRALANLEKRIQKLVDMASIGPPQSRKIRKNHDFCNFHSNFSLSFFSNFGVFL